VLLTLQPVITWVALVAYPALLAGILWRRLHRICWSFPVYLTAVWVGDGLMFVWPSWDLWVRKEATIGLLKLAVAVEIATLTFQAFPGAKRTARRLMVVMLVLLVTMLLLYFPGFDADRTAIYAFYRRLSNGTALIFAAVWALILWYNLPVHFFHRAILRGFVLYLLVFTVALGLIETLGLSVKDRAFYAGNGGYVLLLIYWAWEVWRSPPVSSNPELLRRLQPWRDRL
jgi:hypothetical protein